MLRIALLSVLACAGAALAQTPPPPEASPQPPAEGASAEPKAPAEAQKKRCRTEKALGSLLAKRRVCMTEEAWRRKDAADRAAAERAIDRSAAVGSSPK
jgi:hypothetical protein